MNNASRRKLAVEMAAELLRAAPGCRIDLIAVYSLFMAASNACDDVRRPECNAMLNEIATALAEQIS